jgi:hypothetical protein
VVDEDADRMAAIPFYVSVGDLGAPRGRLVKPPRIGEADDDDLLVAVDVAADPGLGRHGGAGHAGPGGRSDPALLQGRRGGAGPCRYPRRADGGQGGQHGQPLGGAEAGGVADQGVGEGAASAVSTGVGGSGVAEPGGQPVPHGQ